MVRSVLVTVDRKIWTSKQHQGGRYGPSTETAVHVSSKTSNGTAGQALLRASCRAAIPR